MEPPYNKKQGLFVKSVAEEIADILLEEMPERVVEDAWWWERSRWNQTMLASPSPALEDESYLLESTAEVNDKIRRITLAAASVERWVVAPYTPLKNL